MKVIKFGESALRDIHTIGTALEIVENAYQEEPKVAVVVSAMQHVFSRLYNISQLAMVGDNSYKPILESIEEEHFALVKHFIDVKTQAKAKANLKVILNDLEEILYGVYLLWELSPRTLDHIRTFGVRLMAQVFTECLKQKGIKATCIETQHILITSDDFGQAIPDMKLSTPLLIKTLSESTYCNVYTGYLGGTPKGESTTLGKSGSSLTASLVAAIGNASQLDIYADKNGILSADPQYVPQSKPLDVLSYGEAMEIAHFGNTIIYPQSLYPAFKKQIPVVLKNIDQLDFKGTIINKKTDKEYAVKAFSSIANITLVTVHGSGMLGVSGVAGRVFSALAKKQINIILITQASSEHSITLAVEPSQSQLAKTCLEEAFAKELTDERIEEIVLEDNLAILAVIGENMKNTPGIAGTIFTALGNENINVVAIAQGSSELNISIVIESKNLKKAHQVLFKELGMQ